MPFLLPARPNFCCLPSSKNTYKKSAFETKPEFTTVFKSLSMIFFTFSPKLAFLVKVFTSDL